MHNRRVTIYAPHYLPGFKAGGPIPSIANMVEALGGEFDFEVVTSDRDLGDLAPYPGVERDCWTSVGKARVWYVHDRWPVATGQVLYLNSFFNPSYSIKVVLASSLGRGPRQLILAPRGEFSEGALRLKSWKKELFINIAKVSGLYRDILFHASSPLEADDIRRVLGSVRVSTALDLSGTSQKRWGPPENDILSVAFLSRISPKKNLMGAITIMSRVRARCRLTVYGPAEDEDYWASCLRKAAKLPSNIEFSYAGSLSPSEVEPALARHDLFLFPTLGENYGHVIREALSAGLPVLISDQTPWSDLGDAGAALPLNEMEAFSDWIDAFASLPNSVRALRRQAARERGDDPVERAEGIAAMRNLLNEALTRPSIMDYADVR